MPKRYFNWRLAIVLFIFLMVTIVTVIVLRQWQQNRFTYDAKLKGLNAYKQKDWETASKNLSRYLAVNPNDLAILFNYAQAQLNIRPLMPECMQNAITAYRKILRVDRKNISASSKLVNLYLELNVPAEAELIAQRALNEKDDPQIRTMLAVALVKQRKFDQASTELQQIVKKYPDHIVAYELLGKLAEQYPDHFPNNGKYWFNEAIKNNPYSAQAFIARGAFNSKNKDISHTLKDFEKAESLDVSDVNTHLSLASELINVEMFDKAKTHLLAVEAKDSKNQTLWQIWGQLALKMMSKKEMFNVAQNGLKQLQDAPWDFMPLAAELYINCGRFDLAGRCINDLENKNAAPDMIASLEAFLAKAKNQDYQAIILCRKAQKLGDKSAKTMQLLINTSLQTGDIQTAILELRKIILEYPYQPDAHLELARLLAQSGSWAEASQQANQAYQLEPDNLSAALLCIKSQINLIQNNSVNAESDYKKLESQLDKLETKTNGDVEISLLKFQLAMKQGQISKAEAILNKLDDYDQLMEVGIAKVDFLVAQNKVNEAINKLYSLRSLCPQNVTPVKYLAVLLEQYRKEECERFLIETVKQSDNSATKRQVGLLLTQFYYNQGRPDDAYKLLNALTVELPFDIPVKHYLLQNSIVKKDSDLSQKIIDDIKSIEGEDGWQWKYEQANLWLNSNDFKNKYPRIITLLQNNLNMNPADQQSRLLLAQAYEKAGESQLALAAYRQALDISPQDISIIVPVIAGMYKANQFEEADIILNKISKQNLTHPEIAKLQLSSFLRQGDLNSAESILEDISSHDPNNNQVSLSLALLKIRQHKFKMAQELLDSLKKQNSDSLDVSAASIELAIAQKLNDKAISDCNQLVAKFHNASAHIIRGKTYCAIGNSGQAQADFDRAIEIEPNNVNNWIARSNYFQLTGYQQKAYDDMQRALKLDPENLYIIKYNIGLALYSGQSDKIAQGQKLLEKASAMSPDDVDIEIFKAQYLLSRQTPFNDQDAQLILKKITEQHPANTDAWEILARLYLKQDQLSQAMDTVLQGLAYSPDDHDLLLVKVQIEAAHSPELAIPNLKALYNEQPDNIDIISTLAKTYIAMDAPEKAITFLKNNLQQNNFSVNDRSAIRLELAVALYKNGDKIEALQQFDSLYKTSSNLSKVFLTEAKLLIKDQQWDMLNQRLNNRLPENVDKNALLIAIADNIAPVNNDHGIKIAETLLNKVIESEPNNIDAMSSMAMLLQHDFKPHAAAKYYEKILKIEPDNLIAINNLSWIIAQQPDKLQKALDLAQAGLLKAPDYIDLIDTRGYIYYQMGKIENAVSDFSKCIEMYPKNSSLLTLSHFHLAKSLIELGQNQKAVDNLQLTLNLNSKLGGLSSIEVSEAENLLTKLRGANYNAANTK